MTPPVIPPSKLTTAPIMSVVREISDCEINPIVNAEASNQPRRKPPITFKVFKRLTLRPDLGIQLLVFSPPYCDAYLTVFGEMTG